MSNEETSIIEIKKHLEKLKKYIRRDGVVLSLFGKAIIKKRRLDDIICCLEASFPENYKKYVKNTDSNIQSHSAFMHLKKLLSYRTFYSGENYVIKTAEVEGLITVISKTLLVDFKTINKFFGNHD